MINVALIGPTGFVGSLVSTALNDLGAKVHPVHAPRLTHHGALNALEIRETYSEVVNNLAEEFLNAEVVVNAAGDPDASSHNHSKLAGANSLLPAVVALACVQAGVRRYIHISSAAVQGRLPVLDESMATDAFSDYSRSKALGELLALECAPEITVIYRPPSVHGADRRVTRMLTKFASSAIATVAAPGDLPSPQALGPNVGSAVAHLSLTEKIPPPVVAHPSEGLTTSSLLQLLGDKAPRHIPSGALRTLVGIAHLTERILPSWAANARRAEMVWFGQRQGTSWLSSSGWSPPIGPEGWRALGAQVRADLASDDEHSPSKFTRTTQRPTILFGVTTGLVAKSFFTGQFDMLRQAGWDVVLVTTDEGEAKELAIAEGATFIPIHASRNPSLGTDLRTLKTLIRILHARRPTLAIWGTPKLGLLGPIASRFTGTRNIYVLHGLRLETAAGITRHVLTFCERLAATSANEVVAVGHDLRAEAIRLRIVAPHRIRVLGAGSANGVSFRPHRSGARDRMELPANRVIVAFVGRITRDKGLIELLSAWPKVHAETGAALVIAGMREPDANQEPLRSLLAETPCVFELGHLKNLDDLYSAIDLLVLPSHREGYPTVVIEAAAYGVPAVVSNATGVRESIEAGKTGLHFNVGDVDGLTRALLTLVQDPTQRAHFGRAARERARDFERSIVHRQWREYFSSIRNGS